MAKTISFVKGKGSLRHNNREFIANNIDPAFPRYITMLSREAV